MPTSTASQGRSNANASARIAADTPAPKRWPRGSMKRAGAGVRDTCMDSGSGRDGRADGAQGDGEGRGPEGVRRCGVPDGRPRARPSPALADDRSTADPDSPVRALTTTRPAYPAAGCGVNDCGPVSTGATRSVRRAIAALPRPAIPAYDRPSGRGDAPSWGAKSHHVAQLAYRARAASGSGGRAAGPGTADAPSTPSLSLALATIPPGGAGAARRPRGLAAGHPAPPPGRGHPALPTPCSRPSERRAAGAGRHHRRPVPDRQRLRRDPRRAAAPRRGGPRRGHGARAAGAAAQRRDHHRGHGQRPGPHLHRAAAASSSASPTSFLNDEHVLRIIDRIITPLGRRIDQTSPRVDARLPDGSRVNCIIEPLSLIGPVITIRKFAARPYTVEDLTRFGTATAEMFDFLRACVEARLNIFVSGGTGSGKTTTLNVISAFIPEEERIITIEDAAELQLRQEHVVTLEARPANLEGEGEITTRDLLRNALHMRPDRIIVGECRGGEALDMIQAMTVGQEGSLSTGHANSSPDMLRRLETMILMSGYELPLQVDPGADRVRRGPHRPHRPPRRRLAQDHQHHRGLRDRGRPDPHPGHLRVPADRHRRARQDPGHPAAHRRPAHVHAQVQVQRHRAPGRTSSASRRRTPSTPSRCASARAAPWAVDSSDQHRAPRSPSGWARPSSRAAWSTSRPSGPVDPETGRLAGDTIRVQAQQCLKNLEAKLAEVGSSLDRIVWANWSLRDPAEFEPFSEEWVKLFPGDAPVGQGTLMPPQQRRAGLPDLDRGHRGGLGLFLAPRRRPSLALPTAAPALPIRACRLRSPPPPALPTPLASARPADSSHGSGTDLMASERPRNAPFRPIPPGEHLA